MTVREQLEGKFTSETEAKYFPKFEKQSRYYGNGVYGIPQTNLFSTDTRELFLMFVAAWENIHYENN